MSKLSIKGATRISPISTSIVRNKNCKTFQEISCYNLDPIEEEMRLLENKRTKQYKFTVRQINIILGLLTSKLDSYKYRDSNAPESSNAPSTTGSEEKLKNFICCRNPLDIPSKKYKSMKAILLDFIFIMIFYLFGFYVSIKFVMMAFFQAEYNFSESLIVPKFKEGAIRTKMCCFENDRYKTDFDEQMLARFESARAWLEAFNDPIITGSGSATALIGIIGTLPLMLYVTSVGSLLIRRRRADVISFYLNPSGEISRVKKELTDIIFKASESLKNYHSKIGFEKESSSYILSSKLIYTKKPIFELNYNSNNLNMFEGRLENDINHKLNCKIYESNLSNHDPVLLLSNNSNNKTYNQMLFNVNLVEMVRPANLTSKWHKILIQFEFYCPFVAMVAGLTPTVAFVILSIINELYRRVEQRLNLLECQKWKQGAVLIRETMKLSPLNSREDIFAYSTYDGSASKFLQLVTQVEIKYYLTRGLIFRLLEIFVAVALIIFISSFFYYLYVRAFLSRIIWLHQIEEQIKWCTINLNQFEMESESEFEFGGKKEVITHNYDDDLDDLDDLFHTNSEKFIMKLSSTTKHSLPIYQKDRETDIAAIMRAILVTYLNYELYRKQQAEHLKLAAFLLIHLLSMLSTITLFSYFVGTQSSNNFSRLFLLLVPTYLMVFANILLLMGAILISKNSSLTKSILNLLAAATWKKLQLLDLIDLWRRQLLDDDETKKAYAVKLFDVYFSYDSIITLDAYLVALWFILLSGKKFL